MKRRASAPWRSFLATLALGYVVACSSSNGAPGGPPDGAARDGAVAEAAVGDGSAPEDAATADAAAGDVAAGDVAAGDAPATADGAVDGPAGTLTTIADRIGPDDWATNGGCAVPAGCDTIDCDHGFTQVIDMRAATSAVVAQPGHAGSAQIKYGVNQPGLVAYLDDRGLYALTIDRVIFSYLITTDVGGCTVRSATMRIEGGHPDVDLVLSNIQIHHINTPPPGYTQYGTSSGGVDALALEYVAASRIVFDNVTWDGSGRAPTIKTRADQHVGEVVFQSTTWPLPFDLGGVSPGTIDKVTVIGSTVDTSTFTAAGIPVFTL